MNIKKSEPCLNFYCDLLDGAEFEGRFSFPKLSPVNGSTPEKLVPFHSALSTSTPTGCWFHFYEHDYQFERFWRHPDQYLAVLRKFSGGFSPDFSMYYVMPDGEQFWNCWRNRVLAYYLQQNGISTIPNACWGNLKSLDWAFNGLPEYSELAITTQGCMRRNDHESQHILLNGLHELVRQKHPTKLFVYGRFPDIWKQQFPMPIAVFKTFAQLRWEGKNHGKR